MTLSARNGTTTADQAGATLPVCVSLQLPTLVMQTGDTPVAAGGLVPGWVSGNLATLALSATVVALFDLGPDFDQYHTVGITVSPAGPSSGATAVKVYGGRSSVSGALEAFRLKETNQAGGGNINAAVTVAGGAQQFYVRPLGRYVYVSVTNADGANAIGSTAAITCAAYAA